MHETRKYQLRQTSEIEILILILERIEDMAATQADVLTAITALKAQVAAIPASAGPLDEQPVLDAVNGISADLTAKFPPAATPSP